MDCNNFQFQTPLLTMVKHEFQNVPLLSGFKWIIRLVLLNPITFNSCSQCQSIKYQLAQCVKKKGYVCNLFE